MTDGQIYRSILAFDKEKLEMGNAALQTIVEGSLYDMHQYVRKKQIRKR